MILFLLVTTFFFAENALYAVDSEMLPSGVWKVNYAYQYSTTDSVLIKGLDKESLLVYQLRKAKVFRNYFSGRMEWTTKREELSIQLGITDYISVNLLLPHVTQERKSDLIQNGDDSPMKTRFLETYGDSTISGMGDAELWITSRLTYSDTNDFRMGVILRGDTGKYQSYSSPGKLDTGDGNVDIVPYARWSIYPQTIKMKWGFDVSYTFAQKATINDSIEGNKASMNRANEAEAELFMEWQAGVFNIGGGFKHRQKKSTHINSIDQQDAFLSNSLYFITGIGNLVDLEEKEVVLPWQLQLQVEYVLFGRNIPQTLTGKLGISLYF